MAIYDPHSRCSNPHNSKRDPSQAEHTKNPHEQLPDIQTLPPTRWHPANIKPPQPTTSQPPVTDPWEPTGRARARARTQPSSKIEPIRAPMITIAAHVSEVDRRCGRLRRRPRLRVARARSLGIWDRVRCGMLVTKFGTIVFVIFVELYKSIRCGTPHTRPVVGVRGSQGAEKGMGRVPGVPSRITSTFILGIR